MREWMKNLCWNRDDGGRWMNSPGAHAPLTRRLDARVTIKGGSLSAARARTSPGSRFPGGIPLRGETRLRKVTQSFSRKRLPMCDAFMKSLKRASSPETSREEPAKLVKPRPACAVSEASGIFPLYCEKINDPSRRWKRFKLEKSSNRFLCHSFVSFRSLPRR